MRAEQTRAVTPKVFANCNPGLLQPWVKNISNCAYPERVRAEGSVPTYRGVDKPFRVWRSLDDYVPRVAANPGLQFANTFGVRAIHVVVEHSVQLTASRLLI